MADTHIFARSANGRQYIVYSMAFEAAGDLAMVLPLPVPRNSSDSAVRFINLEEYTAFFDDMHAGFPSRHATRFLDDLAVAAQQLEVHDVGCFEASFVPQISDFDRLDERFRISTEVWKQLPTYRDYGFAVFKLKGGSSRQELHPMAFEFPRRNTELLYFPTVHIHDRQVHSDAEFDHMLYCQAGREWHAYLEEWDQSFDKAAAFIDIDRAEAIVDPDLYCWRRALKGRRENKDTLIGKAGCIPAAV